MFVGFPRLGSGVALAKMALIAEADVTPDGYVGRPEAVNDAVAKKELQVVRSKY